MGGVKKKTLSSTKATGHQPGDGTNKPKKDETTKPQIKSQKHKSSVLIEDINDVSILRGMKAITVQSISKVLGVKISIANNYIRNLESKGTVKLIGGYSGHKVYSFNHS